MTYSATDDPYTDASTAVLKNLLGLTNNDQLAEAEASLTAVAITSLLEQPIAGNFDLAHLKAIHQHLFGSIFEWAGKLRTVEMTKADTHFANVDFLEKAADTLFSRLNEENLLNGLPHRQYIARLAHYYSEINILHPFREGNGRTQRAFCTLLATRSGYLIEWDKMDPSVNLVASIRAYNGDEGDLTAMLGRLLVSISS